MTIHVRPATILLMAQLSTSISWPRLRRKRPLQRQLTMKKIAHTIFV